MKFKKILLLPFILVLIAFFVWKSGILEIRRVDTEIIAASCVAEDQIRETAGLLRSNIFLVNEDSIKNKLLDKFVCLREVKLHRKFPGAVKLTVEGRVAIASVVTFKDNRQFQGLDLNGLEATPSSQSALLDWSAPQPTSQQFLADDKGVLFAQFQGEDLPKLFLSEQMVKVGQRLDEGLFKKISIVFTEAEKFGIGVLEAVVSDQDFLILQPQKIAFSLKKDISKQLISLQLILQKAKIDESMIETFDLRFDKPVVKFLPKK